jgi:AsmA protein
MTRGKKIALGVLIFFVVIVLAAIVLVPILIDVDRYRPRVVEQIEKETGKPAAIAKLTLTIFPTLSIRVDEFSLGNPPGFPKGDFLRAKRLYVEVDRDALWDRRVIVNSLELDEPVIHMLSDARGRWNFENPPKPAAEKKAAAAGEKPFLTLGVISKVTVSGGQLSVAPLLASGKPGPAYFQARDVSISLEQVDLSAFIESARALPAPPRENTIFASLFDPPTVHAAGEKQPAAQGEFRARSLQFGQLRASSVRARLRLFPKEIFFDDLVFDLADGRATGNLAFNFAGRNARYDVDAKIAGVNIAKMLEAFPDARGKMSGKMDGSVKLSGQILNSPDPLAGMRGTGDLKVTDGQLPSLQLNKNLMMLARLSNLGPAEGDPSSFKSIAADLVIANQRIASQRVVLVGNGVEVDGAGSMGLAGAGSLEYQGTAKVLAGETSVTNIVAQLSGASYSEGRLSFPFVLSGTLEQPQFRVTSATGRQAVTGLQQLLARPQEGETPAEGQQTQQQSTEELVKGITGLFRKKQTTETTQPTEQK